ncbi:FlgD immunoglobulin-like domain containing protein [Candidatus Cloacimonadota bacterium]
MKRFLLIFCLLSITLMVFAQEWTAIGPLSGKFSSIEWSKHNEDVIYAANNYTIFKTEDHGESWDVLYALDMENFQYMYIRNLTMDVNDENVIYMNAEISWDPSLPQNGIYKSSDGGLTFQQILEAPTEGFIIHPITGKIASYKDGDDGNFYVSEDSGASFTEYTNIPNRLAEIAFDPNDDNIIYASTYYGAYKTVDGGQNWNLIGFADEDLQLCETHPENSDEVWIGSPFFGDEFLYKSVDGGDTWNIVDLPYTEGVVDHPITIDWGSNTDNIYIAEVNEIFVSNDGGSTWNTTAFDIDTEFFYTIDCALNPFNDNEYIAISDVKSMQTYDGGQTYSEFSITAGSVDVIETVENSSGGYYLYAGNAWGLNRYNSTEEVWDDFTEPGMVGVEVRSIATSFDQAGLVVKGCRNALNNANVFKSIDYGNNFDIVWTNSPEFGGFPTEIEESFSETGVFYMSTWYESIPAQLMRSEDFGTTWIQIDGDDNNHHAMTDVVISYQDPDIIYTFGDGIVAKSTDRGETWEIADNGLPFEGVYDGTINPYNDQHLYASVASGIYETIDGGENWIQIFSESAVEIEFNPVLPGIVAAVTYNNEVIISYDNGLNWEDFSGNIPNSVFTDIDYSPDGSMIFVATTAQGVYVTEIDGSYIVPQNLTASVTGFNIELNWDTVSAINTYAIYQNGVKIDETNTNTYTDFYLIPGEYEYNVASVMNGVESELSEPATAFVGGNDLAVPLNLTGEVSDFRDVDLTWEEPQIEPQSDWLTYGAEESGGILSNWIGGNFDILIKFDPEDLTDYNGFELTQIKFIPTVDFNTYALKVLSGENGETEEVNQPISAVIAGEWNTFDLDVPHIIDASVPLYFGFYVECFSDIAHHDAGPAVAPGKSDLFRMNGNWGTMLDFGVDANWLIQGLVESTSQREGRITLQNYISREMTGFKVYKEGEQQAVINDPDQLTYTDTDNEFGTYHYAVTAVYDEGESNPSNEIIIELADPFNPPTNLVYEIENENNINLNWEAPEFSVPDVTLSYGSQVEGGIYEAWIGGNFDIAVRFDAETMNQYMGYSLNSISFKPLNDLATYTLKVWTGEGTEILSSALNDLNIGEINEIILDTPIIVEADTDLWFGYNIDFFGGEAFNYSQDAAVLAGYSNLAGMNGNWMTLADFGFDANNMITGKLISASRDIPVIIGYEVFKDNESLATIDGADSLSYTDEGVEFDTELTYGVKALYEDSETSILSNTVTLYIPTPYLAPVNLIAEGGVNSADLTWEMLQDIYNLSWNSGNCTDGVGLTEGGDILAGIRFSPDNLEDLNDAVLRRVKFFPREDYVTSIRIYTGEFAETLIHEQPLNDISPMEWNEVTLNEDVAIDNSQWFWITYNMENTVAGYYPVGLDEGPAVEAMGDMVSDDNGENWLVLSWNGINANICLSGEAITSNGRTVQLNNELVSYNAELLDAADSFQYTNFDLNVFREVEISSFKIYRDNELVTEINDPAIRNYTDEVMVAGTYEYNVTAVYDYNTESVFSNTAVAEVSGVDSNDDVIPVSTELTGNHPNPFNPTTTVNFALKDDSPVKLEVFNTKGQRVKVLLDTALKAGYHTVSWNGRDDNNKSVSSGLYFYKMTSKNYSATRKMLMLK